MPAKPATIPAAVNAAGDGADAGRTAVGKPEGHGGGYGTPGNNSQEVGP